MKEDKLDIMLNEIYSDDIIPSKDLMKKTKAAVRRPGMFEYIITAIIIFNLISLFSAGYIILIKIHYLLGRLISLSIISFFTNFTVLIIYLNKKEIISAFKSLKLDNY